MRVYVCVYVYDDIVCVRERVRDSQPVCVFPAPNLLRQIQKSRYIYAHTLYYKRSSIGGDFFFFLYTRKFVSTRSFLLRSGRDDHERRGNHFGSERRNMEDQEAHQESGDGQRVSAADKKNLYRRRDRCVLLRPAARAAERPAARHVRRRAASALSRVRWPHDRPETRPQPTRFDSSRFDPSATIRTNRAPGPWGRDEKNLRA